MMTIRHLLNGGLEKIDYKDIIEKYPWIIKESQKCILSPDSDGLLCGLFLSNYLNWKIKGYYDGKVMILDKNTSIKDCIFIDMEIYRSDIKSIGHHMVLYNKDKRPQNWENNYKNCIQPNNLRNYDGKNKFQLKYPLATIHLLLGIIGSVKKIEIPESGICPLLYTDGVFKNLFGYPENCLNWLKYLRAVEKESCLYNIFLNDYYSLYDFMKSLEDFFNRLAELSEHRRGNDKIKISNSRGAEINLAKKDNNIYDLEENELNKVAKFLNILADLTTWQYKKDHWQWSDYKLYKFKKGIIKPSNRNFESLMTMDPISWAMTSSLGIEYTLDPNKVF